MIIVSVECFSVALGFVLGFSLLLAAGDYYVAQCVHTLFFCGLKVVGKSLCISVCRCTLFC